MTTTPDAPALNLSLWYPSFTHFKKDAYRCTTVEDINVLVGNLKKARVNANVHQFSDDEVRHAWNLIRFMAKKIPGAYELSDKTWRMPLEKTTQA